MSQVQKWSEQKKNYLQALAENIFSELKNSETLALSFHCEESQFHRFSKSKVRQSTQVEQLEINGKLIDQSRWVDFGQALTGDLGLDSAQVAQELKFHQALLKTLPAHPFCPKLQNHGRSEQVHPGIGLPLEQLFDEILGPLKEVDMAGFFAAGPIAKANFNSLGQQHLFATEPFFFDFSLYTGKQRAVKGHYSGNHWVSADYKNLIATKLHQLSYMDHPRKKLQPGKYRVYLAPAAVKEVMGCFNWNGPSYRAFKEGQSPLEELVQGKKKFSPLFSLSDDYSLGLSPRFNSLGEVCENVVPIIKNGELVNLLVNTQSALEYKVPSTLASSSESMRSGVIAPGSLSEKNILTELGTGIFIDNLHYLNWSDLNHARITGMTRFACLWVENGQIQGPIEDMRFDDTLYHLWGEGLVGLTDRSQVEPSTDTYGARAVGGSRSPGMLIEGMSFTL